MMKNVDVDVVVVGAGFSGLYLLYRLRKAGFSTRVFERGGDVGGTWYWNRYPGARCDVESLQYSYSFDEQLQQDWHWPEKFSAQPDILAYANHVADRFNLKKDIEFNVEVKASRFDENLKTWKITTNTGEEIDAQYFIMATGCISTTQIPNIKGLSDYVGNTFHTGDWPHEEVDFSGQSIAVIGTGSSGIQSIPVLAKQAKKLTVFQRTPNYSIPSQNEPMTKKYERSWKDVYSERRKEMRYSAHGSLKDLNDVPALSVDEDQRQELYTKRWAIGGTGFLGSFNDLLTNADANYTAAEYVRQQIKRVVKDKETAEILCPRSYPIGTKRICIDTGYFETYNRENVKLVDISKKPIQRLVADGIIVDDQLYAFDSIIFATGFDAMTGSIFNVDIKGRGGLALKEKWNAGPKTYLGLMSASFPNLFMITGPGSPSVKSNMIMSIEQHVDLVIETLLSMRRKGLSVVEPELEAENKWVDHVQEVANKTLFPQANSWYMGANIPGKPRLFMPYIGGVGAYREICEEIVANNYRGFKFEKSKQAIAAE
ncbi:MAG: NAD(P)/FAD-dependent oxidoreductase [Pseudomonadota bacterium]|jgi:cyclohexanone monooxygenase|nr:NAD(P)/FAD-dependent oxidoreductase [Pseudomonadota bacterium]MEC7388222.1 NAD(P)/FAD-dependent oxidoreductase [Pseudomonadota bacterium]MEC7441989.1 NAD(P)/FAD-dependent oxidoreductase [Pseudomonadota bacterium]MEC7661561.1 NAD(P)/FAD-dependent oxidoreductase [Pseudomonadota bacterium]MEC8233574.1 NAD(P)/FAD-dependent oxidoreductase [Pseudomonadota bacterium]|tara:strand:+ start:4919 stop:6544 length:1626 start_codon:yes stop_codon:yes gene_type:complete